MPTRPNAPFIELAPDWICEILSPSTASLDRVEKMPAYAREHVSYLWLLDPIARTLEAFALEGNCWIVLGVHGGNQVVKVSPFDAVAIEMKRLWGE